MAEHADGSRFNFWLLQFEKKNPQAKSLPIRLDNTAWMDQLTGCYQGYIDAYMAGGFSKATEPDAREGTHWTPPPLHIFTYLNEQKFSSPILNPI